MKRLLAIETTADYLGICLLTEKQGEISVRPLFKHTPMRQAELLVPVLDKFLRKEKLKGSDIDIWAVDVGPGSFTGVRVGVAAARAFAQGFKKPLVGVSSLDALAHNAWSAGKNGLIATVLPAVAGEVYGGIYLAESDLRCIMEPQWLAQVEFDKRVATARRKFSTRSFIQASEPAHPENVARVAWGIYSASPTPSRFHYNEVIPLYLQPSWAERSKQNASRS